MNSHNAHGFDRTFYEQQIGDDVAAIAAEIQKLAPNGTEDFAVILNSNVEPMFSGRRISYRQIGGLTVGVSLGTELYPAQSNFLMQEHRATEDWIAHLFQATGDRKLRIMSCAPTSQGCKEVYASNSEKPLSDDEVSLFQSVTSSVRRLLQSLTSSTLEIHKN